MLTEFEYKDATYRITRINGFEQLALAQKLSPLVVPLTKVGIALKFGGKLADALPDVGDIFSNAEGLAETLQKMPDHVTQQIYRTCMTHVERRINEKQWQIVYNPASGSILFPEVDNGWDIMMLSVYVAQDQLGNFISGVESILPAAPQQ